MVELFYIYECLARKMFNNLVEHVDDEECDEEDLKILFAAVDNGFYGS